MQQTVAAQLQPHAVQAHASYLLLLCHSHGQSVQNGQQGVRQHEEGQLPVNKFIERALAKSQSALLIPSNQKTFTKIAAAYRKCKRCWLTIIERCRPAY